MARKRAAAPEPDPVEEFTPPENPVVGRTEAAQAEWEQEQAEKAEAERLRLVEEAAQGGAGPGSTGEHG